MMMIMISLKVCVCLVMACAQCVSTFGEKNTAGSGPGAFGTVRGIEYINGKDQNVFLTFSQTLCLEVIHSAASTRAIFP